MNMTELLDTDVRAAKCIREGRLKAKIEKAVVK